MINIVYIPQSSGENNYSKNNIKLLESLESVKVLRAPSKVDVLKHPKKFLLEKPYDVTVLNWLENYLNGRGGRISFHGILIFSLAFSFFKVSSKRIIYVRHNVYPHGMKGWSRHLAKYIILVAENLSDIKVSHSGHLIETGYDYIPHPLYDLYGSKLDISDDALDYYIIFGRIERYKNIESVICDWPSDKKLIVAGPVKDKQYLDELIKIACGKNVDFRPGFVSDAEAQELIGKSAGMILSHSSDDIIVSGSFFYAITLGTPVFAISTPFLAWLIDKESFKGLWIYDTASEMVKDLEGPPPKIAKFDVHQQAQKCFSDMLVARAWRNVIIPPHS